MKIHINIILHLYQSKLISLVIIHNQQSTKITGWLERGKFTKHHGNRYTRTHTELVINGL